MNNTDDMPYALCDAILCDAIVFARRSGPTRVVNLFDSDHVLGTPLSDIGLVYEDLGEILYRTIGRRRRTPVE